MPNSDLMNTGNLVDRSEFGVDFKSSPLPPFQPFDPRLQNNPSALFAEYREKDPVHWSPLMNAWIVTRYKDVLETFRNPQIGRKNDPFLQ